MMKNKRISKVLDFESKIENLGKITLKICKFDGDIISISVPKKFDLNDIKISLEKYYAKLNTKVNWFI